MKNCFLALTTFLLLGLNAGANQCPVVTLETNYGNIDVELNSDKAPISVANFLAYVDSKFYDQTLVHRVVKGFVIQGGGLDLSMNEKPGSAPIKNEAKNGLSNLRGTIGMARDTDIDSATSEFYFNTVDNTKLDYKDDSHFGYAVFGKIVSGLDVMDAIEKVDVQTVGEYEDVPVKQVVVSSVHRKN